MSRWSRYSLWPNWVQVMFWWALGVAIGVEWVFVENRDLLGRSLDNLVYRSSFAAGIAISLFWWLASVNNRVHRLERKIERLERQLAER